MKSGLEGRNNKTHTSTKPVLPSVSMKSGLGGRNNVAHKISLFEDHKCLNEVRPRRPEQRAETIRLMGEYWVSMKSGLEGRNNVLGALRRWGVFGVSQ